MGGGATDKARDGWMGVVLMVLMVLGGIGW